MSEALQLVYVVSEGEGEGDEKDQQRSEHVQPSTAPRHACPRKIGHFVGLSCAKPERSTPVAFCSRRPTLRSAREHQLFFFFLTNQLFRMVVSGLMLCAHISPSR